MKLVLLVMAACVLLYLIPRLGVLFWFLKCPKCNSRGYIRKQWKFSTEKDNTVQNTGLLDDDFALVSEKKVLSCKKCGYAVDIGR